MFCTNCLSVIVANRNAFIHFVIATFVLIFIAQRDGYGQEQVEDAANRASDQAAELAQSGKIQEAIEFMEQFAAQQDAQFEKSGPEACWARIGLCKMLQHGGKLKAALDVIRDAKTALKNKESQEMMAVLNREGLVLQNFGEYADAKSIFEDAIRLGKKVFAETDDIEVAVGLSNLGHTCTALNQFDEAETALKQSIAMLDALKEGESEMAALAHQNLSGVYHSLMRIDDCDREQIRAYQIKMKVFNYPHRSIANAFANRAMFLKEIGRVMEAVDHAKKAVQVMAALRMENHIEMAQIHMIYASCLVEIHDFDSAFSELKNAKRILREEYELPETHPAVLQCYMELGNYYLAALEANRGGTMHRDNARLYNQLVLECSRLDERMVGFTIQAMNNLAVANSMEGEHQAAIEQLTEVMELAKQQASGSSGHLMSAHLNRANSLLSLGRAKEALADVRRALEIAPTLGIINRIRIESTLAVALFESGDTQGAVEAYDKLLRSADDMVFNALSKASVRQRHAMVAQFRGLLFGSLSVLRSKESEESLIDRSLTWVINTKHRLPEAVSLQQRWLNQIEDSKVRESLQSLHRETATLMLAAEKNPIVEKRIKELQSQEAELLRKSGNFKNVPRKEWVSIAKLRAIVPKDSVVIEIVAFSPLNRAVAPATDKWKDATYLAWIIPGDSDKPINFVELGDAKSLNDQIANAVRQIADTPGRLGQVPERVVFQEDLKNLKKLRQAVWDPLASAVGDSSKVFISPDSAMWDVPWNCLVTAENAFLVESKTITLLGTPRDLVPAVSGQDRSKKSAVLPMLALAMSSELPSTAIEAEKLAKAHGLAGDGHVFLNEKATKSRLRKSGSPRILFIGAHARRIEAKETEGNRDALVDPDLLLADHSISLAPEENDNSGQLTGVEILDLSLVDTELAILAVCEAASGDTPVNEGVASLRNAFTIAGAQNVLGTLWSIPSNIGTPDIMAEVAAGTAVDSHPDYSTVVSMALRNHLQRMKKERSLPHPYYWAAFSLIQGPKFVSSGEATP